MTLRPPIPGLRTLHNGSNDVAKVELVIPAGDELTVSDTVAAQLQARGVGPFKDGPAPAAVPAPDEKPEKTAKKAAAKT